MKVPLEISWRQSTISQRKMKMNGSGVKKNTSHYSTNSGHILLNALKHSTALVSITPELYRSAILPNLCISTNPAGSTTPTISTWLIVQDLLFFPQKALHLL